MSVTPADLTCGPRRGEGGDVAERFGSGAWAFTPDVADVFDEHVRASVPFYEPIQALVAEVADWVLPAGGVFADLGASTGETTAALLTRHPSRPFAAYLYDEAPAMLDRAAASLSGYEAAAAVGYYAQKIEEPLQHVDADLTVALFTLQFLPPRTRTAALANARAHAADDGCLLIAEKIRPVDSRWAEIANDRSHDFKANAGISDAAIRAKARALRGVLIPSPARTLRESIVAAGWGTPEVLFAWHSWVVLGAFAADLPSETGRRATDRARTT